MDELYHSLGAEFNFVATMPSDSRELKGGADFTTRPYCILAGESEEAREFALQLAREADVCVFGACSQEYAIERARHSRYALSFEVGERWLKKGWINVLSLNLLRWFFNYWRFYSHNSFYKLCCGAYTAHDDLCLYTYRGRHFKWGYFTCVQTIDPVIPPVSSFPTSTSIMWCSRFLRWKHPELVIQLAALLKDNRYDVSIDMYGCGIELEAMKSLSLRLGVSDIIHFKGSLPNEDILQAMRNHDIFLFTSDRNEGWGAVLNEAMSNRCAVVASDAIGSAPYLVRDRYNGLLFESEQISSLYEKVVYLLDNPQKREQIAEQGYQDLLKLWSPQIAANNLLQLINDLQNGRDSSVIEGPCSRAE